MLPLSSKSIERLAGVHPLLAAIVLRAKQICGLEFQVTDGARSLDTQVLNRSRGKSKTLSSFHLIGLAVDLHATSDDGAQALWEPVSLYQTIAAAMKQAAEEFGVTIVWGGDWHGSWDNVHFQIEGAFLGLAIGSKGQAVTNVQTLLNLVLPEPLNVDGHFGPMTDIAVRRYKEAMGLPINGIVTYPMLDSMIPAFERSLIK
ncbi:M15 family metallopeptidase [uncultured Cohaesibacter sp.]|uniref:M15 family metallopeptidase n=1 Tax=uncultured Cohaesibacter sp. TaxID=1002546 RepID=UPI0029C6F7D1|nr:M15 family metallopeptidase [uncultured Cohaesibacter sp.]